METGLKNRVALISGASQGLGRATALAFAAEGTHLALCARNEQALGELGANIRERFGVQVYVEAVDMLGTSSLEKFVSNTREIMGCVDVCIINSGGPPAKDFLDATDEDWNCAFDLNLRSAITLARAVVPDMQRRRWGRIVTISSITVRQPLPKLAISNVIRTGIMGLVRNLSNEFGRDGITANNVGPGYTATDRLLEVSESSAKATGQTVQKIQQSWIEDIPVGRLAKPEEIADAVLFLASERAAFITGQTLLVDGGMYKGL